MKQLFDKKNLGILIGRMYSFISGLKLHHWNITGVGSYARHMALDQAIDDLYDVADRIAETSIADKGALPIVIPETKTPTDIVAYCDSMYSFVDAQRKLFSEIFEQSIIDDWQEGVKQLLYRLKRLQ